MGPQRHTAIGLDNYSEIGFSVTASLSAGQKKKDLN